MSAIQPASVAAVQSSLVDENDARSLSAEAERFFIQHCQTLGGRIGALESLIEEGSKCQSAFDDICNRINNIIKKCIPEYLASGNNDVCLPITTLFKQRFISPLEEMQKNPIYPVI